MKLPFSIVLPDVQNLGKHFANFMNSECIEYEFRLWSKQYIDTLTEDWQEFEQTHYHDAALRNNLFSVLLNNFEKKDSAAFLNMLKKQKWAAGKVSKSLNKKVVLLQMASGYLSSVEKTYAALKNTADTSKPLTLQRTIFVQREADGSPIYVVVDDINHQFTPRWLLFADGVMLPIKSLSHCRRFYQWQNPVGHMDITLNGGTAFHFDKPEYADEFARSRSVEAYWAAVGVESTLDKMGSFFSSPHRHAYRLGVNFETQATIDKFNALFPEVVSLAHRLQNNTVALAAFLDKCKNAPVDSFEQADWNECASRYVMWHCLFNGKNIYETADYSHVFALNAEADFCLSLLQQKREQWTFIETLLNRIISQGISAYVQLKENGIQLNKSVFTDRKGKCYLFTALYTTGTLELTRILNSGQLSERTFAWTEWDDIQDGEFKWLTNRA
ncbi:hypothetical protein [Conchiformibius steedae]|uniref:hypothetical protein n=1 Tax=Conchiformibius steedae TaxID=153493 RepID=UPI0026ED96C2|nr:hypothetical protein [Conchiformibius steedae]